MRPRDSVFACRDPASRAYRAALGATGPHVRRRMAAATAPPEAQGGEWPGACVESSLRADDRLACALRAARDRVSLPLARACHGLARERGWVPFGYARLADHSRERFGRSARWVRHMAALGAALDSLPGLAEALTGCDGGSPLGRVSAALIARVADPESLPAWLDVARGSTVRELQSEVRRARADGSTWPLTSATGSLPEAAAGARAGGGDGKATDGQPVAGAGVGTDCGVDVGTDGGADAGADAGVDGGADPDRDDVVDDRSLVRFPVPRPLLAAFDETVDLHRASEGAQTSVTSLVEALVAEARSGGMPPEATRDPLRGGPRRALVETALAHSSTSWSHLGSRRADPDLDDRDLRLLRKLDQHAGSGSASEIDGQIRALLRLENEIERRLGSLLSEMGDRRGWMRLGFAGVGHYGLERLGMARTSAEDRARASRRLQRHPRLREAYEQGRLGLEAVLLVLRILGRGPVDPEAEAAWVARACESTVKRLRDELHALRWSAAPPAAPSTARRERLPLSDPEWRDWLRREAGTARRRIAECGRLLVEGPLPDVFLRLRLPEPLAGDFLGTIEGMRLGLTSMVEQVPWDRPWPDTGDRPSILAARHFTERSRRVPAWVGFLALLEEFVQVWDAPEAAPRRPNDAIYARDGWRCAAPGCSSRRNLEDHHVVFRSRGGSNDRTNRICLCRFHHQPGVHGGLASCVGKAPLGLAWTLGRDGRGGRFRNERRVR